MTTPYPVEGHGQTPAAGPTVIRLEGPQSGRSWDVRNLTATILDTSDPDNPTSIVGGTGLALYIGKRLVGVIASSQVLPFWGSWSRGTLIGLGRAEQLELHVFGLAPATVVQVSGQVEEGAAVFVRESAA